MVLLPAWSSEGERSKLRALLAWPGHTVQVSLPTGEAVTLNVFPGSRKVAIEEPASGRLVGGSYNQELALPREAGTLLITVEYP